MRTAGQSTQTARRKRNGATVCPDCGGGAMPATIEEFGKCSRCAIKAGDYVRLWWREPSWRRVQHTRKSKEQIVGEFIRELKADQLVERVLEFDDTPAGRRWQELAGSGRGGRPRKRLRRHDD